MKPTTLLYLLIFALPAKGAGDVPTSSCTNSDNLVLSRGCNPYSAKFIYTSSGKKRKVFREPITSKSRKVSHGYIYRDNISLQDAIEKYIDIQERQQNRKLMRAQKAKPLFGHEEERKADRESEYEEEEMDASVYPTLKENTRGGRIPDGNCEIKYIVDKKRGIEDILFIDHLHPPAKIETFKRGSTKHSSPTMGILEYENGGDAVLEIVYQFAKRKKRAQRASKKICKTYHLKHMIHMVKRGETLSHIARIYGTTVEELKELNTLGDKNSIKAGTVLKVAAKRFFLLDEEDFAQVKSISGKYTVQKGDSISYLSRRFQVRSTDIRAMNGFKRNRLLKVGEKILIPVPQKDIDRYMHLLALEKQMIERDKKRIERLKELRKYKHKLKYAANGEFKHKIRVVATAYTSHYTQTDKTPFLAAWNNPLRPGMKVIAVSPDLIRKYGLTNGVRVKISGLKGVYTVRDKMNKRLRNHIDIYMGTNRAKALKWGRRRVVLRW